MHLKYFYSFLFLISLTFLSNFSAQNGLNSNLSNEEIEKKIDKYNNDPKKLWELINFYIKKSKVERNDEALFYAYRYASISSTYPILPSFL